MHAYAHMSTYAYWPIYIYIYIRNAYIHTYIHIHIYIHIHTHIQTHTHTHTHTYIHTDIYIYIYIHTCMYIHITHVNQQRALFVFALHISINLIIPISHACILSLLYASCINYIMHSNAYLFQI